MYYNEENNAVFETKESYDMYVKAPRDVKSVIDECNVNMHHDIDVVKQGFADVNFNDKVNIQDLIKEIHVVSGREDTF